MPDKKNQNGWNQNSDQNESGDDFWGKQRDDFWNRNVFDSKTETDEKRGQHPNSRGQQSYGDGKQMNSRGQQSYGDGKQMNGSGQQSYGSGQQSYGGGYVVNNGGSWDYKAPKSGNFGENSPKDGKEEHPRRVISIFFTVAAVLFILIAALSGMIGEKLYSKPNKIAEPVEEGVKGNEMHLYEDTVMLVEDQAYTVMQSGAKKGVPANEKLVAVYVEAGSQSYEGRNDAIRYVYVGNGEEYRTDYRSSDLIPYLLDLGFEKNQYLTMYFHEVDKKFKGYFFFLVPEEWETLNFYVQQREDGRSQLGLEKTLLKEMNIIDVTEGESLSLLLERGTY